eukprot:Rmarinus@m.20239
MGCLWRVRMSVIVFAPRRFIQRYQTMSIRFTVTLMSLQCSVRVYLGTKWLRCTNLTRATLVCGVLQAVLAILCALIHPTAMFAHVRADTDTTETLVLFIESSLVQYCGY